MKKPKRPPLCPADKGHGRTHPRENVSEDQRWCGVWFNCSRCCSSVLYPSKELEAFLAAQRKPAKAGAK